ncbi:MAG: hypothetical protein WBE76_09160 [Terracidiphilus sp.]
MIFRQRLELAGDEPWEPRSALHVLGPMRLRVRFEASSAQAARI